MSDGTRSDPFTQEEFNDWYANLLAGACKASELYSEDELEEYYNEWKDTDEGKRFHEFADNIKWTFGSQPQEVDDEPTRL